MSGGIAIAAAVIGAGAAIYSSNQSAKSADASREQQQTIADQQRQDAITAQANLPQATQAPDNAAVRAKAVTSALTGSGAGNASTFLTGSSGIDDASLNLGKSTLLGQ
jgi:hypothetical protein